MGLFSNNKKLCPICGAPTPRLLATKVEDMPLCKDCAGKIDMQDGLDSSMTLDAFKKYIACYDENQPLREKFHETYRHSFGLFSGVIVLDEDDRLLRVESYDGEFAFQPSEIRGFRITEEGKKLRKAYEAHEIHHGYNEHRRAEPRTDGLCNTITTVQKDNHILEVQSIEEKSTVKVRQATKQGYIECELGGGSRFELS